MSFTTSERIELLKVVSETTVNVRDDIVRIVQNAIETGNETVLSYLDAIANAQVSAISNHKDTLKNELKSARDRRRKH